MTKLRGWGLFLFSLAIIFFTACAEDDYDALISSDVAQATYTVIGTVCDKKTQAPVPNLQVILVGVRSDKESLTGDTVYTNNQGQFTVKSLWLNEKDVSFNLKISDTYREKYNTVIQAVNIENSWLRPEMLKDLGVIEIDMESDID